MFGLPKNGQSVLPTALMKLAWKLVQTSSSMQTQAQAVQAWNGTRGLYEVDNGLGAAGLLQAESAQ